MWAKAHCFAGFKEGCLRTTRLSISFLFLLSMCCSLIAVAQSVAPPQEVGDFASYQDDKIFEQLSGAKRSVLELRYGKKHGAPATTAPKWTGQTFQQGPASTAAQWEAPAVNITVNVPVNNRTADVSAQDTQSETAITFGPTSSTIVVAFNDSGSNFGGAFHFTGYARSTDAGATFTDMGTLPVSTQGDAGDPVLARSAATGTIILSTLDFSSGNFMQMFRSTDNGVTWGAPVDGTGGTVGGSHDKEWIAADNFPGTGQGNFYLFWRNFGTGGGMSITRSTDDGNTWGGRQVLDAAAGQGAFVAVGPDHSVYAFWLASGNVIALRKSTDLGVTWGSQTTVNTLTTGAVNGDLGLSGGFRTNAFPHAAINPVNGNLYVVFNDVGSAVGDNADVYLKYSTDGGATWAPKLKVNDDGGTTDQWQPTIAVTPDGAHIAVSWYDRRINGSLIDRFGAMAAFSSGTPVFGGNFRISLQSFPVVIGQDPVVNSVYMGDYDYAIADNSNFFVVWGDNRDSLLSHTNQPDVRAANFAPEDPGAVLSSQVALSGENCSASNGTIDPNEIVSIKVTLQNVGFQNTVNLVGTLQATGGVAAPSGPQSFGAIPIGGSATRVFYFTATGSCGGTLTATISLQDGTTSFPNATKTFALGQLQSTTFSNATSIAINDNTSATPYPSNVTVSGITTYDRVALTLNGLSHTFPDDIDIIVVAPGGQKAYVMSDVGGGGDVSNLTLTFDDNALAQIGDNGPMPSGTFKPSNNDTGTDVFPGPAPAGPYDTTFANLNTLGAAANGTWSLYVRDDAGIDSGSISGGWSLSFVKSVCCTGAGTNNPPTALEDSVTVPPDSSANAIGVLANDMDPESDPLTIIAVSDPPNGTATIAGGGTFISYSPDASFTGSDSFTYTISDGTGVSTATVSVSVIAGSCIFSDDFEDGTVDLGKWTIVKPTFTENTGDFVGSSVSKKAIAVATGFAGCAAGCSVDTTMESAGGVSNKLWLLGWYTDKKNAVELLMRQDKGKWILKQRSGGAVLVKQKAVMPLNAGTVYSVNLAFDGTSFTVKVDGNLIMTMPKAPSTSPTGTFGYEARATTGRFSTICVN